MIIAATNRTGAACTTVTQQVYQAPVQPVRTQVQVHATVPSHPIQVTPTQTQTQPQNSPQITLEEVRVILRTEEEEEEDDIYEEEEEESENGNERNISVPDAHPTRPDSGPRSHSNHIHASTDAITPRKRSSGDLDADADCGTNARGHSDGTCPAGKKGAIRVGTPPKRARTAVEDVPTSTSTTNATNLADTNAVSPHATTTVKQRKRSSEELDTHLFASTTHDQRGLQKRLRVDGTGSGTGLGVSLPASVPLSQSRCARVGMPRVGTHTHTPRSGIHNPGIHAHARMPRALSTSPPSSTTAVSATASFEGGLDAQKGVDVGGTTECEVVEPQHTLAQARTRGPVDVSMCTIGDGNFPGLGVHRITGLVEGGELDGLYVFDEGV